MSEGGGSPDEMSSFPCFGARRSMDAASAEGLLAGRPVPAGAPADQQSLARLLASASGPASERELAGEAAAVAAFVQVAGWRAVGSSGRVRTAARRSSLVASVFSVRLAVAAVAGAVALGGVAVAGYAGVLPASAQHLAHSALGAPAPRGPAAKPGAVAAGRQAQSAIPVGPDATGKAKHGLCTAYAAAKAHGSAAAKSVAFKNLAKAAGGPSSIARFCAGVTSPGSSSGHPTGPPSHHPAGPPSPRPAPTHRPAKPAKRRAPSPPRRSAFRLNRASRPV